MGRGMDDVPSGDKDQRWDSYVTKWEWNETGSYQLARLFGDVWMDYVHNVETKNGKRYPEYCHGWDVDNCEFYEDRKDRCPCCALGIKGSHRYFMNAIDIEAAEAKPQKAKATWSPIRLISMSYTLFKRLKELKPVNNDFNVADRDHGAIVQIKYDAKAEPASMYSATMDTKNVPIVEEQKEYIVVQAYPDRSSKIVKGENGLPAQFEYIRCLNSRDQMIQGLRRNNYYSENGQSHVYESTREETIARVDAETPIETVSIESELSAIFPPEHMEKKPEPMEKKVKKEPYSECPTEFGKFASIMDCYINCDLVEECRQLTEKNSVAATPKKVAPPPPTTTDEDDDAI